MTGRFYAAIFILCVCGLWLITGVDFGKIIDEISEKYRNADNLRKEAQKAGGKRKNRLVEKLKSLKAGLENIGKGETFRKACVFSVISAAAGLAVSIIINNFFMIPVLSVCFAVIPFAAAGRIVSSYDRQIKEEMETALSIVTNSYLRTGDLIGAVRENVPYMKQPMRSMFEEFLTDVTVISPDLDLAIEKLSYKIDNAVFREWCDDLRTCQNDLVLADTLLPVVSKLTDIRIVNNELRTILQEPRKEYYAMAAMTLANIPLIWLLNKDWFAALVGTTPGKIVLALVAAVVLITLVVMIVLTRPIEYRK